MICGYANIYDLCSNKYTYEYASFSVNNGYAIPNTGYDGSVYRTDKNSRQKVLLEPSSTLTISTCDLSDDNPNLTAWECYLWYKNNGGLVSDPPLSKYKEEQIKNEFINDLKEKFKSPLSRSKYTNEYFSKNYPITIKQVQRLVPYLAEQENLEYPSGRSPKTVS